ncbi:unnamed protein product [Moneuplotes crassus]|uniref:Structural maintenance of chromosomes protein n=1 Tax=Euplotes crassus TaxID=5936 RepID=A0AAD1XHM6_EUPCR|nr:unnamed protein product [Moneuplotes crassus]
MHITQIIIDGFKSYPEKIKIDKFDIQFNAITGANGSGKSNILDAICFVFGIQSLRLVRASNLKELIYKQGTAKVKDAKVTIIFDNTNKELSPPNYDDYDTIEVSREITSMEKSKYRINGKNQPAEKVKSLFLSVHLNVNNPHFLVMQGKITQVVKMKPKQILSLIEETSGTALFEKRKEECLRMLNRKELTLRTITERIEAEIEPMRFKINESRENTRIFEQNEKKIQEIDREINYEEYISLLTQMKNLREKSDADDIFFEEEQKNIEALKWEIKEIEQDIRKLQNDEEEENLEASGLQEVLLKYQQNLDKKEEDVRQKNLDIDSSNQKTLELQGKIEAESYLLEKYKNNKYTLKDKETALENEIQNRENQMSMIMQQLKEAEESGEGNTLEYKNQLEEKIEAITENIAKISKDISDHKNGRSKEKILQEIDQLKEKLKNCDITVEQNIKLHSKLAKEVQELRERSKESSMIKDDINEIMGKKSHLDEQKEKHKNEIYRNQDLNRIHSILELNYRVPQNFNRNDVYGRLVKLFTPREKKYCLPLEIIGAHQLLSIVVTDKIVSTRMLKEKCFNFFVSFIPLRQIYIRELNKRLIERIEQKYGSKVIHALKTISFSSDVYRAMHFVFGNYFICESSQIAQNLIKEDPTIQCITLEGDIYRASGQVSGGYTGRVSKNILLAQEYKKRFADINNINEQLNELQKKYEDNCRKLDTFKRLEGELNDKETEMKSLVLDSTQQKKSISNMIEIKKQDAKESEGQLQELKDEEAKLKEELRHLTENLKKVSKSGADVLSLLKADYEKSLHDLQGYKKRIEELKIQILQNDGLVTDTEKNVEKFQKMKDTLKLKLNELKEELIQAENILNLERESFDKAKFNVDKNYMKKCKNSEEQASKKKQKEELIEEINKRENSLQNFQDSKNSKENKILKFQKNIEDLLRANDWLKDKPVDLENPIDEDELAKKKEARNYYLKENSELRKKINKRVEVVADQLEEECSKLLENKEIVINDKKNLLSTLDKCISMKEETVMRTFEKVNKALDAIFSTLLPGTQAKLRPIDETSILNEGCSLSVAFNGVWKNSLSELSGGQRSLLALSFILAMMKYKPAPIYILDEIDAALDLENTQRIGEMIKKHFKNSQFIIVSLKEQMTFNAKVIFRVSNTDGKSQVKKIH